MNFRRIIQLTSSLAAALTLTACGGGDTGPQWAQDLKDTIVYGQLQLPVGTFYGSCDPFFPGLADQATVQVKVIERINGAYYSTSKVEYYNDVACSQGTLAVTSVAPRAKLIYVGSAEDAVSSLKYQQFRAQSEGGPVQYDIVPDSGVTVRDGSINGQFRKIISFPIREGSTSPFEFLDPKPTFAVDESVKDIVGNDDLNLLFGKADTSTATSDGFPTELDTFTQNRPYRLFSIAAGTYASECFLYEDELTNSTFYAIQKIIAAPLEDDYRPELTVALDFFEDAACTDRLVTITYPSFRVETFGNGIDDVSTPPLALLYQQVGLLQSAGTAVATVDPDPANADRVTVSGNLVSVTGNRSIPLSSFEEEVTYDSFFFSINALYQGNPGSINNSVSPFPTRLRVDEPFNLQVD